MTPDDFFARIGAQERAGRVALQTPAVGLTYGELNGRVRAAAHRLAAMSPRMVASLLDNGSDWVVLDLACLLTGTVHLPLPLFFSPEQLAASLTAAGVDMLVADVAQLPRLAFPGFQRGSDLSDSLGVLRCDAPVVTPIAGTAKITFTSGSTGQPKGVCLGARAQLAVAESLAQATAPLDIQRHLTALPLAVLLENIAGVYAPLMHGAAISVLPLNDVGMQGSSRFSPAVFHDALVRLQAQSVIVLPQMLRAYAGWLGAERKMAPDSLRMMAVGGAAVGEPLLRAARAAGLPAYEGYGLSEACSVQTLNLPGADAPGTAGRPLPHARVRIAPDGEIHVAGSLSLGYLGQPPQTQEWLATGDLGSIDDAGFLHIEGRKKNVLITAFGRNVSPEWVELRLTNEPLIRQAVVLGEARPVLGAVVWAAPETTDRELVEAIERVNRTLPDYARIGPWTRSHTEFSPTSGLATANGRPRRDAVLAHHPELFT